MRPPSMSEGGMRGECGSDGRDGGRESRPREHGEEGMVWKRGWRRFSEEALPHVWPLSLAREKMLTQEKKVLQVAQWHLCVKVQLGCSGVCQFDLFPLAELDIAAHFLHSSKCSVSPVDKIYYVGNINSDLLHNIYFSVHLQYHVKWKILLITCIRKHNVWQNKMHFSSYKVVVKKLLNTCARKEL